ncbi:MAG: type II toxin-antitoxin system HigB family toxin [Hyphomicrobiales bacterium]|nr:type II toxin-antitoxin system HigB family toxin [Hyphomicrobiales bacterium]MBV9974209.1 type II toxin-antitoxin system HigB family toxin [Hyphomicrobiales bacterium]
MKRAFGNSVDFLADNWVVFDIGGNKYRLVVRFAYPFKSALIKFVGTHVEYDRIDVKRSGDERKTSSQRTGL